MSVEKGYKIIGHFEEYDEIIERGLELQPAIKYAEEIMEEHNIRCTILYEEYYKTLIYDNGIDQDYDIDIVYDEIVWTNREHTEKIVRRLRK